jgi:hypothetical protein
MLGKHKLFLITAAATLAVFFAALTFAISPKASDACEGSSCEQKKVTDQDLCQMGLGPKCEKCHDETYNCHWEWKHFHKEWVCDHKQVCESKCSYCDDHSKDNWIYKILGGIWHKGTCPTPTPTPTATPTPEPTFTPTPEPTVTPEETPQPTEGPTAEPTPTEAPSEPENSTSEASAPTCDAAYPGTPTIKSVIYLGDNKIELGWTKVDGADHYMIFYGPESGNYVYSVPDTGNTDTYVINGLSTGYFTVRAVNGCQPGDPSDEASTGGTGGGQVLGASTMAETGTFTDTLFSAQFLLGLGLIGFGVKKFLSK